MDSIRGRGCPNPDGEHGGTSFGGGRVKDCRVWKELQLLAKCVVVPSTK
jgi:hypothetical protein